jgi:predicted nicotinamide N-methyase
MTRTRPELCPEIETWEALGLVPLWEALESAAGSLQEPPYWGWSWPGSQALARYLLDHPDAVRGKNVIDLGAGNGLAAVAAARAGACRALANDLDPAACEMAQRIADLNDAEIECSCEDLLSTASATPPCDVILVGDLFYSAELARRAERWLRAARRAGVEVLVGEPGRDYELAEGVTELASYRVPVRDELESRSVMRVRVLRMD